MWDVLGTVSELQAVDPSMVAPQYLLSRPPFSVMTVPGDSTRSSAHTTDEHGVGRTNENDVLLSTRGCPHRRRLAQHAVVILPCTT